MDDAEIRQTIDETVQDGLVYRGEHGRKRLADLLPEGVRLRDIMPRLVHMIAGPYMGKVVSLETRVKQGASERRVLTRKTSQVPDVIILDTLSLVEVAEILRLREEGLTASRIGDLFEVPASLVRTVISTMAGKHSDRVLFSAEMRRRRKVSLTRVHPSGRRAVDMGAILPIHTDGDVTQTEG